MLSETNNSTIAPLKKMVDEMLQEFFEEVQKKHDIPEMKLSN
jgi:hypothetical protein